MPLSRKKVKPHGVVLPRKQVCLTYGRHLCNGVIDVLRDSPVVTDIQTVALTPRLVTHPLILLPFFWIEIKTLTETIPFETANPSYTTIIYIVTTIFDMSLLRQKNFPKGEFFLAQVNK